MVPASPLMTRASRRKQRLQVQENFEVPAWVHLIGGKFPEIIDRLLANLNLAQELVFACGIESHALHSLVQHDNIVRSEERRVGKECRSRGWREHYKKKRKERRATTSSST